MNKPPSPATDERLELLFRHAGLSEKQAKLYRILLADGEQRASRLAKISGINRSNAYALLKDMKTRGLITQFDKGKITYFRPEPPTRLTTIIETRQKDVELARELATDMIPKLTGQYKAAVGRPIVTYVEGEAGLRSYFEDIYSPGKTDIHGCVDLETVHEVFPDHITKELIPRRIKHGIKAWALLSDSPETRKLKNEDTKQLRTTVLFNKSEYPLPAEIEVYGDKIAFMSFATGEFTGVIINNHDFAESLRSIFRYIFDHISTPTIQPPPAQSSQV